MLIAIFEIICQSLDIQQLFQKAEVRNSECLVYKANRSANRWPVFFSAPDTEIVVFLPVKLIFRLPGTD